MEQYTFITEEQETINQFEEFKKSVSSAPFETQIRAILDGIKISTTKQILLKDATNRLISDSKRLIFLTKVLIFLTIALILVGIITIFHH